ncbi:MAG TPA: GNAT family N-acetyltransferase [Anaerolineales bacterium]|nr:GNAT family N-acetyltransferase [Anaerolineales bacterium]
MTQYFETFRDTFTISTDPARLDVDTVCELLARSYWASGRPCARTERALKNSLVFGMYIGVRQIGLARVVTDYAIFAYLCDVIIHEDYRGHGLGKWLMESVLAHPDLQGLRRWTLATRDAHGLYRQYGFDSLTEPERWMEMFRPYANES